MWKSGETLNISIAGNFVTDAMVWAYRASAEPVVLAIINSGGIRASFDRGNITMEDLLISFPFRIELSTSIREVSLLTKPPDGYDIKPTTSGDQ